MAYKKLVTNKLQEIAYWCSFEEEGKKKKNNQNKQNTTTGKDERITKKNL